jgi:hypothetical protein
VDGSCERGNEPSGSIKRWEVLEWLHNWQLLKKGSAPWVGEWVSEWVSEWAILRRFVYWIGKFDFHFFGFRNIFFLYRASSSALRPTQKPRGQGTCIYVLQWRGGPVIPPDTEFPFRRLLRLTGLRWKYSELPPYEGHKTIRGRITERLINDELERMWKEAFMAYLTIPSL